MRIIVAFLAAALAGCVPQTSQTPPPAPPPAASRNPLVGGAVMDPARTIIQNLAASRDHTIFVAAVRASGLETMLSGRGPYTVFAPTNAAFDRLPPATVETLMHPSNKPLLARLVGYHVVPERRTRAQIGAGGAYRTMEGSLLRAGQAGGRIVLSDVNNGRSEVTQADIVQANGVSHVVGAVLLPRID